MDSLTCHSLLQAVLLVSQTGMQVLNLWSVLEDHKVCPWCTPSTTGDSSAATASHKGCFLLLANVTPSAWARFWPAVSVHCDELNLAPMGNGD